MKIIGMILTHNNEHMIEQVLKKIPKGLFDKIFVTDDNSIKYIVDGNHRVQKAIRNKLETIKVKLIKFSELPQNFKNVFS